MTSRVNYGGLVIAGTGFFLTRFTVTLVVYENPVRFYVASLVPLALGLGLAAFGVALAVADVEASTARTTALWCVIGTGTMLVLVALTLVGSTTGTLPDAAAMLSQTHLSNFLIGGSVGGTLTGLYAARTRRQRSELRQQANRLQVLNRMLRHEVLNSVTAIRGYAAFKEETDADAEAVIENRSNAIEQTIDEVGHLTRSTGTGRRSTGSIDLGACLAASVETVTDQYPEVEISIESQSTSPVVRASERLEQVFSHLLENAAVHATDDTPAIEVSVTERPDSVRVSVRDEGPGLPQSQRTLLETGDIAVTDNPEFGFGLNIVRFHVEEYGGTIETDVSDTGTTITVALPRADRDTIGLAVDQSDVTAIRPDLPHLLVTLGAAIIAGLLYGVVAEQLGGSVGFIGVYYGVQNPVIGWVTHEFHSVVFAFVFAGIVSLTPVRHRNRVSAYIGIGVTWALVLWVVAAGIISPVWLRLVGIAAPIPNLSVTLLVTHLTWGISLGVLTALGDRRLIPRWQGSERDSETV